MLPFRKLLFVMAAAICSAWQLGCGGKETGTDTTLIKPQHLEAVASGALPIA